MKKSIALIIVTLLMVLLLAGCTQADRVAANISKEADNFNVVRRISVLNMRTDKPVFELIGNFSISNSEYNELVITCQTGPTTYKKHFVYLNNWTMYVVEDISGAFVDPYHYEINFLPEMIIPFTFTSND
ncbi:MAG TPA: hypothetical protein VN512_13010 [Clostridia bacterium]|nr:hypothetical protein [Clostridia bacterium]